MWIFIIFQNKVPISDSVSFGGRVLFGSRGWRHPLLQPDLVQIDGYRSHSLPSAAAKNHGEA